MRRLLVNLIADKQEELVRQRRIALGIDTGHDASATLCDLTGVLASIAEERLNRIKHFCDSPRWLCGPYSNSAV